MPKSLDHYPGLVPLHVLARELGVSRSKMFRLKTGRLDPEFPTHRIVRIGSVDHLDRPDYVNYLEARRKKQLTKGD